MSRPYHSSDFITHTIVGYEYKSWSSSLCSFLHSPVTSSLLGPNIPLNTPFSNTLNLRTSLNVSDQVSRPYKTTGISQTWAEGIRGMMREKGLQEEDWTDRNNWRRKIA
jgi:hypothetical protein